MQEQLVQTRPIRILIGTPAGGGMVDLSHELGMMQLQQEIMNMKTLLFRRNWLRELKAEGIISEQKAIELQQLEQRQLLDVEVGYYSLQNESLLCRGRNHIAAVAIRQGWDKLFFIDADASFTFDQFMRVAITPLDFVAGVCPLKVLPISLNYLPFEDDEHYYRDAIRSMASLQKMREGHGTPFIPVAFVGTAFMCISRKVLLHCAEASEEYMYPNPLTQHLHTHWNMFDTRPMHGKFMSEDWSMCHRARELGFQVHINADVVISHMGKFNYCPQMANLQQVPPPQGVFSTGEPTK